MDNARGYELHLKQLEGIYQKNRAKKLDSSNGLNERILRSRNVNRKAMRGIELNVVNQENTKMLKKLDVVNARKNKFPQHNYRMPTGIFKFDYEQKLHDQSSQRAKSRASQRSLRSHESMRSKKSFQSKLSQTSGTPSTGSKNLPKERPKAAGQNIKKPSTSNQGSRATRNLPKPTKPSTSNSLSRHRLGYTNIDPAESTQSRSTSFQAGQTQPKPLSSIPKSPIKEPNFIFHSKKRHEEKERIT